MLSETAQSLVQLATDVLREAVTTQTDNGGASDGPTDNGEEVVSDGPCGKSSCGRQLLYMARNMFEMFASLVPVYHQNVLSTVPQLAGKNMRCHHCH